MIINGITIELYQEADNQVGSEHATVEVKPALIELWNGEKNEHFFTFKSEHGFSFNDKEEIIKLFDKIEKIVELAK